ncbi:hypothetical protein GDO81_016944 [Engystomops pustulosus]|uniref:Uncharacterized protein n=1 Tax=Engystomops pustulosus TaxID=76066 RepID=A0AAV7ABV4_ENGPU|nr:hypothetical protein GDO81_016944 [Engystomops pustulosus]
MYRDPTCDVVLRHMSRFPLLLAATLLHLILLPISRIIQFHLIVGRVCCTGRKDSIYRRIVSIMLPCNYNAGCCANFYYK